MYITTRDLNCFGKWVKSGEPIPTPEKWRPEVLQANINMGYVKEVPDKKAAKPKAATKKAAKATAKKVEAKNGLGVQRKPARQSA